MRGTSGDTPYTATQRWLSVLRDTLDATADGILVLDSDGRLVTYNARCLELWKVPAELAAGNDSQALVRHVAGQLFDPAGFTQMARDNQAHPERDVFTTLRFRDGRVMEASSRPQRVNEEVVGRVLAFRDVTEKDRLLTEVAEAVRTRDELLCLAAHEIAGPITSMRLAIESLRSAPLPADAAQVPLEVLDRTQRRVVALVEKLLDLGRMRAGTMKLEREPTDLADLVRDVVHRLDGECRRAGSTVSVRAASGVIGMWDRLRLDQVVTNLLSNAIKFGAGRPIDIEVRAADGQAVLVVHDRGVGIAPEVQSQIFKAFARAVPGRSYDGLGLGLHIARTIVDALGGTIGVRSQPGAGATFQVSLPLAAVWPPTPQL